MEEGTGIGIDGMLIRLMDSYGGVMELIMALAYVFGFCFIGYGLYQIYRAGDIQGTRVAYSPQAGLFTILFGGCLLAMPWTMGTVAETIIVSSAPDLTFYQQPTESESSLPAAIRGLLKIFGVIAYLRGLLLLRYVTNYGEVGEKTYAAGVTRIIGGILCCHIVSLLAVIADTTGITFASDWISSGM